MDFLDFCNHKFDQIKRDKNTLSFSYNKSFSTLSNQTVLPTNEKKKNSLSYYDKIAITQSRFNSFSDKDFKKIKSSNISGYIFKDKGNTVAKIIVNNKNHMIETLFLSPEYMGYKLYPQLIDVAVNELKGYQIIFDTNSPRIKRFLEYGFKVISKDEGKIILEYPNGKMYLKEDMADTSNVSFTPTKPAMKQAFINSKTQTKSMSIHNVNNGNKNDNADKFNRLDLEKDYYDGSVYKDKDLDIDDYKEPTGKYIDR